MSAYNIHLYDKVNKNTLDKLNVGFLELSEEFPGDSKTSSNQPR